MLGAVVVVDRGEFIVCFSPSRGCDFDREDVRVYESKRSRRLTIGQREQKTRSLEDMADAADFNNLFITSYKINKILRFGTRLHAQKQGVVLKV